jgi:hypothetical protein
MNGDAFCGAGRNQNGRVMTTGLAGTTGFVDSTAGDVAEVSGAVAAWVEQVGQFLGVVQATLEQSRPREDATAEVRAVAGQLPALIRQCRAQVPTPDMIHTWVQTLAEGRGRDAQRPAAAPGFGLPRRTRSLDSGSVGS